MNSQDLVRADDIFLYISESAITSANTGQILAFATSCSLETNGETIDTSNKMSCMWNSNLSGKKSYTVSSDALYTQNTTGTSVTGYDKLMKKMLSKDSSVYWAMGVPTTASTSGDCDTNTFVLDTSKVYYHGYAAITSLNLNAGNNEVASSSITLTGDGDLKQENVN